MSAPDYIGVIRAIPPKHPAFPHSIVLLPHGLALADVGRPRSRVAGVFLVDPDCAGVALSDPVLDSYVRQRTPVFVCATRARDLRPFMRRAESFRRRGFSVEVIP